MNDFFSGLAFVMIPFSSFFAFVVEGALEDFLSIRVFDV